MHVNFNFDEWPIHTLKPSLLKTAPFPPPPPTLTNLYGDTSLNYCIFIELNSAPYRNTHYPMEYEFMALSVCKVLNIMHTYSAGK